MTKTWLLGLLLVSSLAQAEWVLYGDNGKAAFYYDDKSIVSSGNSVSVWEMLIYSFPLNGVQSNRAHKEYNCASLQFRSIEGEFYSEPYLKGKTVSSNADPDDPWRPTVEGTRNQELMHIVCGQKS